MARPGCEPGKTVAVGTLWLFFDLPDLLGVHAGGGLYPIHCQFEYIGEGPGLPVAGFEMANVQ